MSEGRMEQEVNRWIWALLQEELDEVASSQDTSLEGGFWHVQLGGRPEADHEHAGQIIALA